VCTPVGSKDVQGVNGVSPGVRLESCPGRLAVPGGAVLDGPTTWSGVVLKVIRAALMKYDWVSVRNTPPAG